MSPQDPDFRVKPETNPSKKWYFWLFIALLAALLISTMAGESIKRMFFSLLSGITPIIGAVIIAFLLLNPMKWIENKLLKNAFIGNPKARVYKRMISLTICYVVLIGFLALILGTLLPNLISTLTEISKNPEGWNRIVTDLTDKITGLVVGITGIPEGDVRSYLQGFFDQIKDWITNFGHDFDIANIASMVFSIIFGLFMSLLLSFLMLKDKDLIAHTARRFTYAYKSKYRADEIILTTHRTQKVLDQWLVCNLITMIAIFIVAWIGYAIIGVKFAGIMALLLAILSLVPYLGGFIAMIPVALVTLVFGTTTQFLAAIIFGLVAWAVITTVLPPIVISSRLNIRALFLLLIMLIAGALFGIWGMILSGPIAAMSSIWFQERLRIREGNREREDTAEALNISPSDLSDVLDLREDVDVTLLDTIEKEKQNIKKPKLKPSGKKEYKKSEIKREE